MSQWIVMTHQLVTMNEYTKEIKCTIHSNGCWIYAGRARDRFGYTVVRHGDKTMSDHRYDFLKHKGPISPGLEVRTPAIQETA